MTSPSSPAFLLLGGAGDFAIRRHRDTGILAVWAREISRRHGYGRLEEGYGFAGETVLLTFPKDLGRNRCIRAGLRIRRHEHRRISLTLKACDSNQAKAVGSGFLRGDVPGAGWRRPFRSAIARVATIRAQNGQGAKGGALLEQGSSFFGERAAELKNNSALPR